MKKFSIPLSELEIQFSRSGGAGGQNVNKVNTKATVYWDLENSYLPQDIKDRFRETFRHLILDGGKVQIQGQKHRTQKQNVDDCIEKLEALIAEVAIPPKLRKATKPKRSAVLKRLTSKKRDGEKKRLRKSDY